MAPDVQRNIHDLIQKLKGAAIADRDRISVDLETAVRMACDLEMQWDAPAIIRHNNRTYRAYPID